MVSKNVFKNKFKKQKLDIPIFINNKMIYFEFFKNCYH